MTKKITYLLGVAEKGSRYYIYIYTLDIRESKGKKWSGIIKLLLTMGVNLPRKKYLFFWANFAWLAGFFFWFSATIRINQEMLSLPYAGFFLQQTVFFPQEESFRKIVSSVSPQTKWKKKPHRLRRLSFFYWLRSSFIDIHCFFSSVTDLQGFSG